MMDLAAETLILDLISALKDPYSFMYGEEAAEITIAEYKVRYYELKHRRSLP